jgi:hypothetical protein
MMYRCLLTTACVLQPSRTREEWYWWALQWRFLPAPGLAHSVVIMYHGPELECMRLGERGHLAQIPPQFLKAASLSLLNARSWVLKDVSWFSEALWQFFGALLCFFEALSWLIQSDTLVTNAVSAYP